MSKLRSTPNRSNSESGFSLVEVLIATAVLVVGLVGTADLLAVSVRMHQLGRNDAEAVRLARSKLDELMKMNFATAAEIQVSPPNPNPLTTNVPNYFDAPPGGMYIRRWRVQAGPTASVRLVTVQLAPVRTELRMIKPVQVTTLIRQW